MRLRTYSRPWFPGRTPSAIRKLIGPRVVGEDVEGAVHGGGPAEVHPADLAGLLEDRGVEVRLVDGVDALDYGRGAFEAEPGVDTRLGQGDEGTVLALLVLVEDEVPDLQEPRVALVAAGAVLRVL
jgi:hypothetical protein